MRRIRPRVATPSLAAAFVDPALQRLCQSGARDPSRSPVACLKLEDGKVTGLTFSDGEESLAPQDRVILAVPPWTAQELLPGLSAPDAFRAIVNAHFKIVPPAGSPLLVGLIGGTAEWVFAFADRLSVTVSAADRLLEMDTPELTALLWRDVAAVHSLAGPSSALPHRQGEARHLRGDARTGCPTPAVPDALGQSVSRRRLDRYRAAGDDRGRAALRRKPRRCARVHVSPPSDDDTIDRQAGRRRSRPTSGAPRRR